MAQFCVLLCTLGCCNMIYRSSAALSIWELFWSNLLKDNGTLIPWNKYNMKTISTFNSVFHFLHFLLFISVSVTQIWLQRTELQDVSLSCISVLSVLNEHVMTKWKINVCVYICVCVCVCIYTHTHTHTVYIVIIFSMTLSVSHIVLKEFCPTLLYNVAPVYWGFCTTLTTAFQSGWGLNFDRVCNTWARIHKTFYLTTKRSPK